MSINMSEIQSNATEIDSEALYKFVINDVETHNSDTYLEALTKYVDEHDLDISSINKYISPSLKSILYKEACLKNMILNPPISNIPEELFGE